MKQLGVTALALLALGLAAADQPMIGQPAPPFELSDLEGNRVALKDFSGRFVVLHFATSW
jgi:cytochrome oxidase Cu insertion factor (SCO1/SenC/PrrC family)